MGPGGGRQGVDVRQWAVKLGRYVGIADIANLSQALDMPTYQTMMGALQGQPTQSASMRKALAQADVGIESLGSAIADTTYTPLPNGRCRIADSRVLASPLSPFVERTLDVEDVASYAAQGGSGGTLGDGSNNCGIPSFSTAYAVSLTVLPPPSTPSGLLKLYENNKPWSEGNPVLFTQNDFGASNDMIVRACQNCVLELAIQSGSAAHYVVDIVGYFSPPQATNLQCTQTAIQEFTIAAGASDFFNNSLCPTGYHEVMPYCYTSIAGVNSAGSGVNSNTAGLSTFCAWHNTTGVSRTVYGGSICCRVPGR
jgi:hypothetical protein